MSKSLTPVDEDLTVLDQLEDLAPPCEYSYHSTIGYGPAVWAVRMRTPRACGCHLRSLVLICNSCWTAWSASSQVYCVQCKLRYPPLTNVVRLDRL